MENYNISVYPYDGGYSNLLAFVNVEFCNENGEAEFLVKGLKLLDGKNGKFLGMPSYQTKNGEYQDIAFPLTKAFREDLTEYAIAEYEKAKAEKGNNQGNGGGRRGGTQKQSGRAGAKPSPTPSGKR